MSHDPIFYPDGWNTFAGWFAPNSTDPIGAFLFAIPDWLRPDYDYAANFAPALFFAISGSYDTATEACPAGGTREVHRFIGGIQIGLGAVGKAKILGRVGGGGFKGSSLIVPINVQCTGRCNDKCPGHDCCESCAGFGGRLGILAGIQEVSAGVYFASAEIQGWVDVTGELCGNWGTDCACPGWQAKLNLSFHFSVTASWFSNVLWQKQFDFSLYRAWSTSCGSYVGTKTQY